MGALSLAADLIRPYVPRLLIDWLREQPHARARALEGSVAFIDVSGFTKLSERLARHGKVGAEELTEAIETSFARLLGVAYANGGGLLKFGGDALLLFFGGEDHPAKASRAAVGMRAALREISSSGVLGASVTLRMSAGVHSGIFHFFLVGNQHRELIITGPAVTETVEMEATASAGEICVSRATAEVLPFETLGKSKGAGVLLRRSPPGSSHEDLEHEIDVEGIDLLPCIPVAIREQLVGGAHEAEHRRVTVAFVHFDGTDELLALDGPDALAGDIEALVCDVQAAAESHGVAVLGSDVDRDGGKIILAAGAPVATGNDEESMLLALRTIVDGDRRIPIRIGVNRGHVFAGDIGPRYRRTYTVMGDAVNLAARLMAKAEPGTILATGAVLDASRTRFETAALEPFLVKGKARPVQAFAVGRVLGTRHEVSATGGMVGREHEVSVLLEHLASAIQGKGGFVEISGEPGLGKSRLIEELRARSGEAVVHATACELYESSRPYFPFRGLLRALLGIAADADDAAAVARVHEVVAAVAPDLQPWAPLVAIVVDAQMADTPETQQLDERFRRARINEAVGDLMAGLLRAPSVIVIEDTHWMDEASADLLAAIERRAPGLPWLICTTRREVDAGFVAAPTSTLLRLGPLGADAAVTMLTRSSEDDPLLPDEIATLAERSGGNPLFLKELLAAARSEGGLSSLPDSVEALIMARIDRLAPVDRDLLRRAAVLGRSFKESLLRAVLDPDALPDATTWERLGDFLQHDGGGTLMFVHALMRDGAYEGLPFRLRRALHARAGETIEREAGQLPDDEAELLSMHFFYARRFMEAWRYSLAAAERAKAIYANAEATEFFERALQSARSVEELTPHEVARVQESLGDVRNRMGAYADADRSYRAVRALIGSDPVADARLILKIAGVRAWLDRYSQALRWVTRGLRALEDVDTEDAAKQRAELLVWRARFLQEEGRYAQAIRWCRAAVEEASRAGNMKALAYAYRLLDWAYVDLGRPAEATHSEKALGIYEELEDLGGKSAVLNNMGATAYWAGRWNDALDLWQRSTEIVRKTGDLVNAALNTNNIAEILSDQGRLDEAEALIRHAMRVCQAAGYRAAVAYAKSNLGRVAARAGRIDEGIALLTEARAESLDVGAETEALEATARLAECHLLRGDAETAAALAVDASIRAHAMGGIAAQDPMLERIKAYAAMQQGDLAGARSTLEESLRAGRARNATYEVALTLRGFVDLARLEGKPQPSGLAAEADQIMERLGVRSTPSIPLPEPSAIDA